jgi:hypothetical protein
VRNSGNGGNHCSALGSWSKVLHLIVRMLVFAFVIIAVVAMVGNRWPVTLVESELHGSNHVQATTPGEPQNPQYVGVGRGADLRRANVPFPELCPPRSRSRPAN